MIEITIYITGFFFLLAVLSGLIFFFVNRSVVYYQQRREIEFKKIIDSSLCDLKRWCGYEFPIVEDVCDELLKASERKAHINSDIVRSKLRNKYEEQPNE